jgi:beta-lactamase regulating signal transducer with metallopeptidase domain
MIELVAPLAPRVTSWLATASIEMLALAAVALLVDRIAGQRAHHVRTVLWQVVLLRTVVPSVITLPLAPDVALRQIASDLPAPSIVGSWSALSLSSAAGLVWLMGVLVCLWLVTIRTRRLRGAWNGDPVDERSPLWPRIRAAAAALGLAHPPDVRVSALVTGPVVVGFLRPRVVLPLSLSERSEVEIDHVLLHEIAHVVRRDPLAHLACLLVQTVFWFHPVVWLANRRLALLREIGCDRRVVLALGGAARDYRHTLLRLAAPMFEPARPPAIALLGGRSQLVTRLDALERPVARPRLGERLLAVSLLLALLACGVPWAPRVTPELQPPDLAQLPGSLQKRYAVMRYMAAQAPQPSERWRP